MAIDYTKRRQRASNVRSQIGSGIASAGRFLGGFFSEGPRTLGKALGSELTVRGQQTRALQGLPPSNNRRVPYVPLRSTAPAPIAGRETLNPEALAIQQSRQNQPRVAGATAQPTAPTPVGGPPATGGFNAAGLPAPAPSGFQAQLAPTDPAAVGGALMRPQIPVGGQDKFLQDLANKNPELGDQVMDELGYSGSPNQAQEGEVIQKTPKFADTYRSIYDELGLGDIRSQLDSTGIELQDLQDKKVDEISEINENPWLTEGQRQDRVDAINKKFEMREGNLINRLELFQSTFEQGRQEAQFIASQTAEDQRAERTAQLAFLEKQMEAEQKLREKGEEVLSVADARSLGVPYGTTVAEARKMGVIPEADATDLPALAQEFQFAQQNGYEGGFLDFIQAKKASESGATGDKVLSPTEAAALGVPYGTTESQAYGQFATGKPTVEESKARQFAVAAENANQVLNSIGYDPGAIEFQQLPNVFKGEKRQQFEQAARAFVNATLRRESGATITDSEFTNKYKELIDQAGDAPAVKQQKAAARAAAVQSIQEAGRLGAPQGAGTGDELDSILDSLGFRAEGGVSNTAQLKTLTIGKRNVRVAPSIALRLASAAQAFKRATGKELQVNQDFRTREEQEKLYRELSKKGARVAPPGHSFHERGLAIDVTNWKEAEPYLRKYGLVNDLPDDRGHFSFGETNRG